MSGHQCKCENHGQGPSHGQGHSHNQAMNPFFQISPEDYFKQVSMMKQKYPEFYAFELVKGNIMWKYFQYYGLTFMKSVSCQFLQGIGGMVNMMCNCEWMPIFLRPFVAGLFWLLLILTHINYKIITGFGNEENKKDAISSDLQSELRSTSDVSQVLDRSINVYILIIPLILYIITALRTAGNVNNKQNILKHKNIFEIRPYFQNPGMQCRFCKILKTFRSCHCAVCGTCIPKFSRHSFIFGTCIGAANQLPAFLFFLSTAISLLYVYIRFIQIISLFGIITLIIYSFLMMVLIYCSVMETITFLTLNFYYGLTEYQIENWMSQQYLMAQDKMPMRQFSNNMRCGLKHSLIESLMAFLFISGYQDLIDRGKNHQQQQYSERQPLNEEINNQNQSSDELMNFPPVVDGQEYYVNWAKAYMYIIPQIPYHSQRQLVINTMKMQEPKMVANYKIMKRTKDEIRQENPGLSEMQVNQRASLKMQQQMMKNGGGNNMGHMGPMGHSLPPQQQKMIQLQMLGHLKMQFKNQKQLFTQISQIQGDLKEGKANSEETGIKMRNLQQKVMEMRMKVVLEQQAQIEKAKKENQGESVKEQNSQQQQQQQQAIAQRQQMMQQMMAQQQQMTPQQQQAMIAQRQQMMQQMMTQQQQMTPQQQQQQQAMMAQRQQMMQNMMAQQQQAMIAQRQQMMQQMMAQQQQMTPQQQQQQQAMMVQRQQMMAQQQQMTPQQQQAMMAQRQQMMQQMMAQQQQQMSPQQQQAMIAQRQQMMQKMMTQQPPINSQEPKHEESKQKQKEINLIQENKYEQKEQQKEEQKNETYSPQQPVSEPGIEKQKNHQEKEILSDDQV